MEPENAQNNNKDFEWLAKKKEEMRIILQTLDFLLAVLIQNPRTINLTDEQLKEVVEETNKRLQGVKIGFSKDKNNLVSTFIEDLNNANT